MTSSQKLFSRVQPEFEADLFRFLFLSIRKRIEGDRFICRTALNDVRRRWLWRRFQWRRRSFEVGGRRYRIFDVGGRRYRIFEVVDRRCRLNVVLKVALSFWKSFENFVVFFDQLHRFGTVLSTLLKSRSFGRKRLIATETK